VALPDKLRGVPRGSRRLTGPLSQAVARIISAEVEDQGLTQKSVAAMLGVSQSMVSLMLRGLSSFTLEEVDELCHELGLDPGEVVTEATARR
jgi:transcriptional regulator with XRE-family HTH domain